MSNLKFIFLLLIVVLGSVLIGIAAQHRFNLVKPALVRWSVINNTPHKITTIVNYKQKKVLILLDKQDPPGLVLDRTEEGI